MNLEETMQEQVQESERTLARMWKITVLQGVLAIAFGVLILVWPNIGLTTLIALVAAFAIVSGVATLIGAFRLPLERGQRWWLAFQGLLAIAVGVVIVVWPNLSAVGLLYAVGALAIALGIFELAFAFAMPFSGGRSILTLLGGLLSIAFGVIMFAKPGAGAIALLALVAAFAIVTGVMQVAFGIELRRVASDVKQSFRPRPTAKPVAHA